MKCKTIRKVLPLLLASSMLVNMCSSVAYADSDTIINGTIKASTIDISASGTATYTIDEKTLISDTLQVLNNANFPVSIAVADVTKTSGTIEDVLPSAVGTQDDWFNLGRKDSESKIALGLKHTGGDYLEEFTSDTVYFKNIQDSTDPISLGAIAANTNAEYEIDGFHGLAFSSEISEQYKITWDIGLYDGSGSSGGSSGSESGDVNTYSVDREEDTALTYDLTNNDTASAASMFSLDDLFGVHTVKAAPIDVPQDEVTNIVGEATITGLKDTSISELYIADYYQDENGDYYKITGIAEGTAEDPTIESDSLTKVVISGAITEIPNYAFYGNKNITDVVVEDGVTRIGKFSFYSCSNLEKLILPNSLDIIDHQAFSYCYNLTSVNSDEEGVCDLPDGLETIGVQAFFANYNLEDIYIPVTLKTMDYKNFGSNGVGDTDLAKNVIIEATDITDFPEITLNTETMSSSAGTIDYASYFSKNTSYFYTQNVDLAYALMDKTSSDIPVMPLNQDYLCLFSTTDTEASLEKILVSNTSILVSAVVPSTYNGLPVTTVNNDYLNYQRVKMIEVPDSITTVTTSNVFKNVSYIINNSSVENSTYSTSSTTKFITDNSLIVGDYLYEDQTHKTVSAYLGSETQVTIPNGVEAIGDKAFYYQTTITSITIPEGVSSIGDNAFKSCSNLVSVNLPTTITSFGSNAFASCSSLTEFTIPEGVTDISSFMFMSCTKLGIVNIPTSVTTIGSNAFAMCTNSTKVINYQGTQEQWNSISGVSNDYTNKATINYETY